MLELMSIYTETLALVVRSHYFSYHFYTDDAPVHPPRVNETILARLADIPFWMSLHQLELNPDEGATLHPWQILSGTRALHHY